MATVRVVNETRGSLLASRAATAAGWWSRARGLIGRRALAEGEGLLIQPCNSVHCFFMAFAIDVVYIDRAHRVVRLAPVLRPYRLGPIVPAARAVLELPAGVLAATGTQVGDQLRIEPAGG
jgi:hypothetical protein